MDFLSLYAAGWTNFLCRWAANEESERLPRQLRVNVSRYQGRERRDGETCRLCPKKEIVAPHTVTNIDHLYVNEVIRQRFSLTNNSTSSNQRLPCCKSIEK